MSCDFTNRTDTWSYLATFSHTLRLKLQIKINTHNVDQYEGRFRETLNVFISLQPLGVGHAAIPHIKAMDVPFHLIYGSLICAKRLQSDRQNKVGCLQTPAGRQNMIIKYLSVGKWS